MATVRIDSEEEAIDLFLQLTSGQTPDFTDGMKLEFGDWVNFNIYLPRTPVEGSISPTMMKAFIDLQTVINRSYKLVESSSPDLRTLTNLEKDMLEFRVVVEKGSSDYIVQLINSLEKIGVEAVSGMTPEMKLITLLGLALIVSGSFIFKHWIATRADTRQKQIDSDATIAMLENHKEIVLAALDAKKENVAEVINKTPLLKEIDDLNSEAREHLVKAVGAEGGGRIMGTEITPELASEITSQTRSQSQEIFLKGNYRISKVDSSIAEGFTVRLINDHDQTEITASLLDSLISADHRALIQDAEWNKAPVWLEIKAKKIHARITDAVIIDAKPATT